MPPFTFSLLGRGFMAKAVIFDVDGTLVDSVDLHARAWQDALHDYGHDFEFEDIRSQIGKGGDQLMPVFLDPGELEARGEALEKHRGEILRARYLHQVTAFPAVRALFKRLQSDGKQIALASSAKKGELAKYKQLAQIEDLIHTETSSDDAEKSKPHPDIFQAAMKRLRRRVRRRNPGGRRHALRRGSGRQGGYAHDRRVVRRLLRGEPAEGRLHRNLQGPRRPAGPVR